MSHTAEPWTTRPVNFRGEPDEWNWYVSGNAQEVYEDDDEGGERSAGAVATGIAIVLGNRTAGTIPRDNARRIVAAINALAGLSDEQVAAIPRVLSLASELAALAEMLDEYQPGTDLFTVAEVLKLAMAGVKP